MHYRYPKIGVLGGFRGENLKLNFCKPQKALPYPKNTSFGVLRVKIGPAVRAVPEFKNPQKTNKKYHGGLGFLGVLGVKT